MSLNLIGAHVKSFKHLAPLAAAVALLAAPLVSHAALVAKISNGIDPDLIIMDGSALDGDADTGSVSFVGAFGAWNVAAGIGATHTSPYEMGFTAAVTGQPSDGILRISFSETDVVAGSAAATYFNASGGGSASTGAKVSWAAYADAGNAAFGTGSAIFAATGAATAAGSSMLAFSSPYSVTLTTVFDYTNAAAGNRHSSLDLGLTVPEPTSVALVGLALCGLAMSRRRKA